MKLPFALIVPLLCAPLHAQTDETAKTDIPVNKQTWQRILSEDGWDPKVIENLKTCSGRDAYRTYWTLRQSYNHLPQVYDRLVRSVSSNPEFVLEMRRLIKETPYVADTSQERKAYLECVGDFKAEWAVRLLGEELMSEKKLDIETWPEERVQAYLDNDYAAIVVNSDNAALELLEYGLAGAPRRKDRLTHLGPTKQALRKWWLANKDRIPEILEKTFGAELLPDPPGLPPLDAEEAPDAGQGAGPPAGPSGASPARAPASAEPPPPLPASAPCPAKSSRRPVAIAAAAAALVLLAALALRFLRRTSAARNRER